MSKFRDRCRSFGRGLYVGGIGAGIGLFVFFAAYLWVFASHGPLSAMHEFKPTESVVAVLQSFVFVTTAGVLGRRDVSAWRVIVYSCLALLITLFLMPATSIGWRTRKLLLMENPLFEMEYVWVIFAFNAVAIAVSYASAPYRFECSRTVHEEENLVR